MAEPADLTGHALGAAGRARLLGSVLLVGICLLAWAYTLYGVGMEHSALGMTPFPGREAMAHETAAMPGAAWNIRYAALLLAMWAAMMVAMMLPAALPVILLAAAINRRAGGGRPFAGGAAFAAGYLAVWLGASVLAVAAQWGLSSSGLLGPGMASTRIWLTAILLIAAGLWQLTPAKRACLRHCRAPQDWLVGRAGRGWRGAAATGIGHGGYCLGCCWALMTLLFAGGAMNLWWVGGLALVVLLEKHAPRGAALGQGLGAGLAAAGLALLTL